MMPINDYLMYDEQFQMEYSYFVNQMVYKHLKYALMKYIAISIAFCGGYEWWSVTIILVVLVYNADGC